MAARSAWEWGCQAGRAVRRKLKALEAGRVDGRQVAGERAEPLDRTTGFRYFELPPDIPTLVPPPFGPSFSTVPPTTRFMTRTFTTSVHRSKPDSPSLRTTVPVGVATVLNIQHGDSVVWIVEPEARRVTVAKRTAATAGVGR